MQSLFFMINRPNCSPLNQILWRINTKPHWLSCISHDLTSWQEPVRFDANNTSTKSIWTLYKWVHQCFKFYPNFFFFLYHALSYFSGNIYIYIYIYIYTVILLDVENLYLLHYFIIKIINTLVGSTHTFTFYCIFHLLVNAVANKSVSHVYKKVATY